MRVSWLALTSSVLVALQASAATVTVHVDDPGTLPGEDVIVTVTLDVDGTERPTESIYVGLTWDDRYGQATQANQVGTLTSFGGAYEWILGGGYCGYNYGRPICLVIDQIGGLSPVPVDPGQVIATLAITRIAAGDMNVGIFEPHGLRVFDLETQDVIVNPEPSTGLLVLFGLTGLAAARRR